MSEKTGTDPKPTLIFDSSVVINFLRIDRTDLLTTLPYSLYVVDVVRNEITHRYQSSRLEEAIARSEFEVVALQGTQDLQLMESFRRLGLGLGESASLAAAIRLPAVIAMDDISAIKKAKARESALSVITTQDIVAYNIQQRSLSIAEADAIKADWAANHRFALKIASFADILDNSK